MSASPRTRAELEDAGWTTSLSAEEVVERNGAGRIVAVELVWTATAVKAQGNTKVTVSRDSARGPAEAWLLCRDDAFKACPPESTFLDFDDPLAADFHGDRPPS